MSGGITAGGDLRATRITETKLAVRNRRADLPELVRKASFPLLLEMQGDPAQHWLHDYVSTLVLRDIRELADIEKASKIPDLLNIMAAHGTGLLNEASLARVPRMAAYATGSLLMRGTRTMTRAQIAERFEALKTTGSVSGGAQSAGIRA